MPEPDPALVARLRAAGCVYAEEEAGLLGDAAAGAARERLVRRREAGEPLEHVLGWVAFDGHRVGVGPGVFVPRQRTAYLVELADRALDDLAPRPVPRPDHHDRPPRALDLCCGSGALGLALARRRPGLVLHAVDDDPVAVACAERNLREVGGLAYLGDLTAPLPAGLRGSFDVLLANVPYVPTAAVALLPAEARAHEPIGTLDGGPDGLALLRRVAELASTWLRPGGTVLCEVADDQANPARAAFAAAGLQARVERCTERGATAVCGRVRS